MNSNLNHEDCKKAFPSDTASAQEVDAWVSAWMCTNVNSTFFLRKSLGIEGRTMHILYKMFATIFKKKDMRLSQKLSLMRLFLSPEDSTSGSTCSDSALTPNKSSTGNADSPLNAPDIKPYDPNTLLTTFTCFPKLPEEIRIMIWRFASFLPRNLDVFVGSAWINDRRCSFSFPKFTSSCPTPSILHVSHESRTEGLKHYDLEFSFEHNDGLYSNSASFCVAPEIYVNPASDTICPVNSFDEPMSSHFGHCSTGFSKVAIDVRYLPYHNLDYGTNDLNDLIAPVCVNMIGCYGFYDVQLDEIIFYDGTNSDYGIGGCGGIAFADVDEDECGPKPFALRKHAAKFNKFLDQCETEYNEAPILWKYPYKRPLVKIAHALVDGERV